MSRSVVLTVRFLRTLGTLANCCINFRFEKERYTPYTKLSGEWYCPKNFNIAEVVAVMLNIDGVMIHYGYPTGIEIIKRDGRTVLKVSSVGYTAALASNQCKDGLLTDVDLSGLAAAGTAIPIVAYQQNTPTVNYVNYYDGTSSWDAIVCYSLRASGKYPYIYGYNTVRIEPHDNPKVYSISESELVSRGSGTDYSKIISYISEKDVDGTPAAFTATNGLAAQRTIVRAREINFDREWIMDSEAGLRHRINYSMRAINYDSFGFCGYAGLDLLDRFRLEGAGFEGEVDRIVVTASAEKGFVTTVECYHDGYCA